MNKASEYSKVWLSGSYRETTMVVLGRKYPVASGQFQESGFDWPLSGYEFEVGTVASRPNLDVGQ